MKKSIFCLLVFALLGVAACREHQHHEGDGHEHKEGDGHKHEPGDTTHQGHGTAADTMHHEHVPGDTTHKH